MGFVLWFGMAGSLRGAAELLPAMRLSIEGILDGFWGFFGSVWLLAFREPRAKNWALWLGTEDILDGRWGCFFTDTAEHLAYHSAHH